MPTPDPQKLNVRSPVKRSDAQKPNARSPVKRPSLRSRVKVFWNEETAAKAGCTSGWYAGEVVKSMKSSKFGTHCIQYDDDKAKGRGPIKENLFDSTLGDIAEWKFEADVTPLK